MSRSSGGVNAIFADTSWPLIANDLNAVAWTHGTGGGDAPNALGYSFQIVPKFW